MNKNKATLLLSSLIILSLTGCMQENTMTIEKELNSFINKNCSNSEVCTIDLNDFGSAKWDRAYIFQRGEFREPIERAIGIPYTLYEDIGLKFIFIADDKIVNYGEIFPPETFATQKENINVTFYVTDGSTSERQYFNHYELTPNNAKLKVNTYKMSNDNVNSYLVYELTPSDPTQMKN